MLPPTNPVQDRFSYFDLLMAKAQKAIPGVRLNFDGYGDLIDRYIAVSDLDSKANFKLAKDFNMWFEYMSDIANYIQMEFLDAETDKIQIMSQKSIDSGEKNVASGDRKANTDPDVIAARKRRNTLKAFYDALVARQDFCEKAFYQCKYNCMENAEKPQNGANNASGQNLNKQHY